MPDLSEMLGDVYGEPEEPAPAPATGPASPAWADDEHLDRAFAEWTPGPGADAPAAERSMFAASPAAAPAGPAPRLADDLAAALSEAVLAESEPEAETKPEADVATDAVVERDLTPSALADLEPEPEPEAVPEPIPTPVHKAGWQRSDDDILPTGRSARGGVRLPRPPRARKAPKAPKAPSGDAGAAPKKRRSLKDLAKMEIGGKKKK